MNSDKVARYLFITVSTTAILGLTLVFGLWSGYHKNGVFRLVESSWERLKNSSKAVEETSFLRPDYKLQPARFPGDGVTINTVADKGELILLSGFFKDEDANELRLIRRDGTLVNRWPVFFKTLFPNPTFLAHPPASDWNVDTHGALVQPDGSVVFNFDYNGTAKLDRCGKVIWTLGHQTHHSIERAESGGYWVLGQREVNSTTGQETPYPPFFAPYMDSKLLHVSESGEILTEISVPELFFKNHLEGILTSASVYFESVQEPTAKEIVHINKVAELSSDLAKDFPMFEAGDLLLSMRSLNLVMVVAPDTQLIKWWQIGPWKRQHDPEFIAGGKILVFNNNTYIDVAFGPTGTTRRLMRTSLTTPRISNIIEIDPATDEYRVRYGYGGKPGEEMLSVVRGKLDPTREGGILVTESDGGRAFEIDANRNIVWQYVNRYDDDEVAELTEARVYDKDYFTVDDWSCP